VGKDGEDTFFGGWFHKNLNAKPQRTKDAKKNKILCVSATLRYE
jgi:hypothetical protein